MLSSAVFGFEVPTRAGCKLIRNFKSTALALIAALAASILFDLRAGQAYAQAFEGPWCALQNVGSGSMVENCRMATFEQCRLEVVAGNRGFCKPNARWPGARRAAVEQHSRRSRKHRARHR